VRSRILDVKGASLRPLGFSFSHTLILGQSQGIYQRVVS
jgi:hypothetical protein